MKIRQAFWATLARQIRHPEGLIGRGLGHLMAWEHRRLTEWGLAHLDVQPGHRVLDVGCGSGMALRLLVRRIGDGVACGADYSDAMVRQAIRRNRTAVNAGRAEVRRADVVRLPYEDETFDRVIAIETFLFWPEPLRALRELRRVLKPNGRLIIVLDSSMESPDKKELATSARMLNVEFYSGTQLVDLLRSAGFVRPSFDALPDRGRGWLCAIGDK